MNHLAAATFFFNTSSLLLVFSCKQVAFDKGVRARTVTLDGDAFEPQGTLTGGSAAQLGVVLARLAELQAASRDLGVHEERLRGVVDKIGRLSVASKKVLPMHFGCCTVGLPL